MNTSGNPQSGYVLVSVTVVLLTVLASVLAINNNYTSKIKINRSVDPVDRKEIEASAFAHLQALAEQQNCGADPFNIVATGRKDGFDYSLTWGKDSSGPTLHSYYQRIGDVSSAWASQKYDLELYGETQQTTWVLAPYFSEFAEIREDSDDHHHDHDDHAKEVKAVAGKDIALRTLKLGPLATEPLTLISAELQLTPNSIAEFKNPDTIDVLAIKYPWAPASVTHAHRGIGSSTAWPTGKENKFESLNIHPVVDSSSARIDLTALLQSWLSGARPNYGWALKQTGSGTTKWQSGPDVTTFDARPKVNLEYRCACGEVCVGVKQNEAVAMASNSEFRSVGGGENIVKHWLHRGHPDYGQDDADYTAALSEFQISGKAASKTITGLHIEPANLIHPDHHYYTVMQGKSATNLLTTTPMDNISISNIYYLQSAGDKPIGKNTEARVVSDMGYADVDADDRSVGYFISDTNSYVGGFSFFDDQYWLGRSASSQSGVHAFSVTHQPGSSEAHVIDSSAVASSLQNLGFLSNQVPDALHILDAHNIIISGEYHITSPWDIELGDLRFEDGDVVVFNLTTKKARSIATDTARSELNGINAMALYEEPIPDASESNSTFEDALPFLF